MPTGYTADLYEGKEVTFETFVLTCARAMGAAVMQRDEPLGPIRDDKLGGYEKQALADAKAELKRLRGYTPEEWVALESTERTGRSTDVRHSIQRAAERRARYESMLAEVEAWRPPTPEHQGLKDFMIEQLTSSIEFDCSTTHLTIPARVPWEEFKAKRLAEAEKSVDRAKGYLAEHLEREASRKKWVRDLRESLRPDQPEPGKDGA